MLSEISSDIRSCITIYSHCHAEGLYIILSQLDHISYSSYQDDTTALMRSSAKGDTAVVELLLEAGADIETKNIVS